MSQLNALALSGLRVAKDALASTFNNISNANTTGYSRQSTQVSQGVAVFDGNIWRNAGVLTVANVRSYDRYLDSDVRNATAESSYYQTLAGETSPLVESLTDGTSSLVGYIDRFKSSLADWGQNPADSATRMTVIANGRSMASRFNALGNQLANVRSDIDARLRDSVDSVNAKTAELAKLNEILSTENTGQEHFQRNNVLDKRDQLVRDLAEQVGVKVNYNPDSTVNVFLNNGQSLVVGLHSFKMGWLPAGDDEPVLGLDIGQGQMASVATQSLQASGQIGAFLNFRETTLRDLTQRVDRLAANMSAEVNLQHQQGLDLNGDPGGALFSTPTPRAIIEHGTAQLSVTLPSNYATPGTYPGGPYELSDTGSGYELTRPGETTPLASGGLPLTYQGVTIDLANGSTQAGDRFRIETSNSAAYELKFLVDDPAKLAAGQGPSASGPGDNRNAIAMSTLFRTKLADDGTSTFGDSFAAISASLATKSQEVNTISQARSSMKQQAVDAQQSFSGVNLEEEGANLVRQQQMYQAASQALSTAKNLFDEILSVVKG